MTTWYVQPVFNSYLAVALVALVLGALLLVGPTFRRLSRGRRWALIGLRAAVILLVLLALLRPARISTSTKPQTGVVVVMGDNSRSMQLPSGTTSRTRWVTQIDALAACESDLAALAQQFDVKVYAFDSTSRPLDLSGGRIAWPERPEGRETDIGSSLADAAQGEMGRRILGVVLISDGVQTALAPRMETQEAARELARQGAPLFTTTIGPVGDAAEARDLAMEYLQDQYTVFVKNEVVIKGIVRITGYANKAIPIELILEDAAGKRQTIGPQQVSAKLDGQQVEFSFPFTPIQAGQYKLTVRAAAQPGELTTRNNELQSFLNVLDGGLRVLYLEGDLRWEQKYLRRSLNDSPDIDVDFQWIDLRTRDRWPVDFGDVLANPKWDVVLIGDLDAAALGAKNLRDLARAIDSGKGLGMLGGFHSFGAGGYQTTVMADVLPVQMDRLLKQDFNTEIVEQAHIKGPLAMRPVHDHPLVRLGPAAENAGIWSKLPPLSGANLFRPTDIKQRFRSVADAGETPLLVPGDYGQGRVLAFAGDSTWQWWMQGREAEHRRFWRQVVLWLAKRDEDQQGEVWVTMRQRRFNPGAQVTFEAGAKTAAGAEVPGATISATITGPDKQTRPARLTKDGAAWSGLFTDTSQPGDYQLVVEATAGGKRLGTASAQFLVFDQDLEMASQAADSDLMARLSNLTKEAGGRVVPPEGLPALFRELAEKPRETEVEVQTKWQLGDTTLDAWTFFLLFVGLLTGEWWLRKKWGLV
jgi:hypothetical protein